MTADSPEVTGNEISSVVGGDRRSSVIDNSPPDTDAHVHAGTDCDAESTTADVRAQTRTRDNVTYECKPRRCNRSYAACSDRR